jgi:hypothetical protein
VTIRRWDVYEVFVEAPTGADAEERSLEAYEEMDDPEHEDGGVDSVYAEEEEE